MKSKKGVWVSFIILFTLNNTFVVEHNLEEILLSFVLCSFVVHVMFVPYITKKTMFIPPLENELVHGDNDVLRGLFLLNGLALFLVCLFF